MAEKGDASSVMIDKVNSQKFETSLAPGVRPKYEDEWNELCRLSESGSAQIQQYVIHMGLQGSRFRSVVWQLLLHVLPSTPSLWVSILRLQRHNYRLLRQKFTIDPHCTDLTDNPLSQSSASKWHQYFCDRELRSLIRQDVVRAFPGVEFFCSEGIQCTMVNILFCYAREHPKTCYRQGMHEVLAPIIYVMHCDQQSLLHAQDKSCLSIQAVEIFDPTCLEEDAYFLFSALMRHLASSYHVKDMFPLPTGHFPSRIASQREPFLGNAETEVVSRLKWIRDNLLSRFDPELHHHVVHLDIPFQTFGIRWLRVLFGQEFPLKDLLYLWDAIFAEDDFDLVNYIVVAMLSAIREDLLSRDDNDCLILLMKYPAGVSVQFIVELALHMQKPEKYPAPLSGQVNFSEKHTLPPSNSRGTLSGRLKQFTQWSQRKGSPPSISSTPVISSPLKLSISRPEQNDGRQGVIEGYFLNDPVVMKAELQHSQSVLFLVHSHLERYHGTLESSLPPNIPAAARAALAGIKELCIQLHHVLPTVSRATEVEAASEAEPAPSASPSAGSGRTRDTHTQKTTSPQFPNDCPMKEIKICEGIKPKSHFPLDDPLQALCYIPTDKDFNKHILYSKILGARLN